MQVKDLDLPLGGYVVIGSGVMSAYGIRPHQDIDLLVTQNLYEELIERGWKHHQPKPGFDVLTYGIAEAAPNIGTDAYCPDAHDLISRADIINGIAFTQLSDVIELKEALGRKKDIEDIELIRKFLDRYSEPLKYFSE